MRFAIALVLLFLAGTSVADEVRPGYLQLKETTPDVFSVLWKVPAKGDMKLGMDVLLPDSCKESSSNNEQLINGAYIKRWIVPCKGGLVGKDISIAGLAMSSTDVLLHLELNDGSSHSAHLTPTNNSYRIPEKTSSLQIAKTYTGLGVEHILLGVDHLLFVFALLLIVRKWRRLVATITAFTVAHSITLGAATLGLVHVPQRPVEAVIALSILFLATEFVHGKQGRIGAAARWPWLIAFVFGLLHGFGFANALAEIGLPQQAIPLALVFFNVGVELGQLAFVAGVLILGWAMHKLERPSLLERAETAIVYTIGGLSTFWLLERMSAF